MKIIKVENLKMKNLLVDLIFDNNFYDDELKQEIKNHLTWKDIIEKLVESEGRLYIVFFSGFKIELPLIKGNRSYNLFIDYSNHLNNDSQYFEKKEIDYWVKCKCGMKYKIVCNEIQKDVMMVCSDVLTRNELENFHHQRLHCCRCGHYFLFCHETPEKYAKIKRVEFDYDD